MQPKISNGEDVLYSPDCELKVVVDIGKEGDKLYIPKGTIVRFHAVVDDPNDLTKSLVMAKFEDRMIVTQEVNVRPLEDKKLKNAFDEFNKKMMIANPELRVYHPNIFVRTYFKIYYFFKRKFKRE